MGQPLKHYTYGLVLPNYNPHQARTTPVASQFSTKYDYKVLSDEELAKSKRNNVNKARKQLRYRSDH